MGVCFARGTGIDLIVYYDQLYHIILLVENSSA